MKKNAYETPQMEVVNISGQTMMTISNAESSVFDDFKKDQNPEGGGRANRRRNSWGNTSW